MQMQERNLPADHAACIAEQVTLNRLRNGNGASGQSLQDQMVCPATAQCYTLVLSITYQRAVLHVGAQYCIPMQSTSKIANTWICHCIMGKVSSVYDMVCAVTQQLCCTCGAYATCRRYYMACDVPCVQLLLHHTVTSMHTLIPCMPLPCQGCSKVAVLCPCAQ